MTVIFNKKNIKQASASHKNSYLILIYFFYQWQQNQLVEVLHSSSNMSTALSLKKIN